MIEVGMHNVTKHYGFNKILDSINLEIKTKERIGIVGVNGSGKTTILNLISGLENPNSGDISLRKGLTIGYLKQIPKEVEATILVKDVLYESIKDIWVLKERLEALESQLESDHSSKVMNAYGRLQEEFISKDGYIIEEKVQKIINGFNISQELFIKPFNNLSSGEKAIVLFASLMLTNPDLLLLDEPTNHLDIKTLNWLEKYLNNYSGTVIMVSHDRYFLNKTTNKIILLERGNLDIYHGNYDYYLKERENRIMLEFKNYKNQQKQIEAMKKAIKQLEEWGALAGNEMFFKRARSIQKRIDKMELVAKPLDKKAIPIIFDTNNRSGNDVLKISHLTLEIGNRVLLCGCNMEINYQERVCLMGNNGTGKSTLIKEIISNNNTLIKIGSNIKIGYMEQNISFDNDNMTVLEYAKKYYIGEEKYLRSILYKFLFIGEQVYKRIGKLSGGEKVRLKLFQLMQENCNFLILDEPTNHIDIETKEILEEALLSYDGTILFISHDRYFIDKVATKLLTINNQTITTYLGNYSDYDNHMFN